MTTTKPVPVVRPRALQRLIGWALVLVLIILGAATVPPVGAPPATAAPVRHQAVPARHGVGLTLLGQWVGTWRVSEGRGFCVDFTLDHPDSTGAVPLGRHRVPGMTRKQSDRVAYVASHYARTRSTTTAVAAALVIWRTQHAPRFDRYYARLLARHALSSGIRATMRRIEREARDHRPYAMSITLGSALVGQHLVGTVRVTQAGRPARGFGGIAVRLSIAPTATLVAADRRTRADGRLTFRLRVARPGAVRVRATASLPSTGTVRITRPTRGHQHLLLAGPPAAVRAQASSMRTPSGPQIQAVCTSDCDGVARVSVTAANACGSATQRISVFRDGRPVRGGTLDLAACGRGRIVVSAPDGGG